MAKNTRPITTRFVWYRRDAGSQMMPWRRKDTDQSSKATHRTLTYYFLRLLGLGEGILECDKPCDSQRTGRCLESDI